MDREEVMRVLRAFELAGLEYVLIGAAAMESHGLVRTTEDLDLFIRATPEMRTALPAAYEGDPHINEISSSGLYPAVRYVPHTGDLYFDVGELESSQGRTSLSTSDGGEQTTQVKIKT